MKILNKFLSFWLCMITIGGLLSYANNSVSAKIVLTEQSEKMTDYPSIAIRFDGRQDIDALKGALDKVFEALKKHNGAAMCPYELLRSMFVSSFKSATSICFFGNNEVIIEKLCGIFTDIILRCGTISNHDSLAIISLNYSEVIKTFHDSLGIVIEDALRSSAHGIKVVYFADGGYRLVIDC